MLHLKIHSTHFYSFRHVTESDSERGNLMPLLHGLLFQSINQGLLMHHPTDRIVPTTTFVPPAERRNNVNYFIFVWHIYS